MLVERFLRRCVDVLEQRRKALRRLVEGPEAELGWKLVRLLVHRPAEPEERVDVLRLVGERARMRFDELVEPERRLDLEVGEDRAVVRLQLHEAAAVARSEIVEHGDRQRVVVALRKHGDAGIERVHPPLEGVCVPAGALALLDHEHLLALLGEQRARAQPTDSAADDDDVVGVLPRPVLHGRDPGLPASREQRSQVRRRCAEAGGGRPVQPVVLDTLRNLVRDFQRHALLAE